MTPTAPSQADIVRASSTIEATRRGLGDNRHYPILEAAETMSAAYHALRIEKESEPPTYEELSDRIDELNRRYGRGSVPRQIKQTINQRPGIERPGVSFRPWVLAAMCLAGGAVWVRIGWAVFG